MGPGDRFILMDGMGNHYRVRIESVGRHDLSVQIEEKLPPPSQSPLNITIGQAVLKSKAMDMVIQKCSELGVNRLIPFYSERTVFTARGGHLENRMRRWLEVSRGSAKQSGRQKPLEIGRPLALSEFLQVQRKHHAFKIILWEGEKIRDLKETIRRSSPPENITGLIGPEGGFTESEIVSASNSGFIPVTLGQRILRAETANIALTAIFQYEWGDLGIHAPPSPEKSATPLSFNHI
jgi:16S rRNA (uracil1498-N3)-methyltransferase